MAVDKEKNTRFTFTINRELLNLIRLLALHQKISASLWITRAMLQKIKDDEN